MSYGSQLPILFRLPEPVNKIIFSALARISKKYDVLDSGDGYLKIKFANEFLESFKRMWEVRERGNFESLILARAVIELMENARIKIYIEPSGFIKILLSSEGNTYEKLIIIMKDLMDEAIKKEFKTHFDDIYILIKNQVHKEVYFKFLRNPSCMEFGLIDKIEDKYLDEFYLFITEFVRDEMEGISEIEDKIQKLKFKNFLLEDPRYITISEQAAKIRRRIWVLQYLNVSLSLLNSDSYLFSWDKIPGNDNLELIRFIEQKFSIDWVKTAKVEKIDDGRTIRIFTDKNNLSLTLNDEKTEVTLKIDDVRTDEFITKMEHGEINIYPDSSSVCKTKLIQSQISNFAKLFDLRKDVFESIKNTTVYNAQILSIIITIGLSFIGFILVFFKLDIILQATIVILGLVLVVILIRLLSKVMALARKEVMNEIYQK